MKSEKIILTEVSHIKNLEINEWSFSGKYLKTRNIHTNKSINIMNHHKYFLVGPKKLKYFAQKNKILKLINRKIANTDLVSTNAITNSNIIQNFAILSPLKGKLEKGFLVE